MSSNLKVNTILPSIGTAIGIGTASGNIDVLGHIVGNNTPNISGINSVTATTFYGDGQNITGTTIRSNLTYDGNTLQNLQSSTTANLTLKTTANSFNSLILDSNRAADTQFAIIDGRWNGNVVNRIQFVTGSDGTNKDDGYMAFHTRTSGASLAERLRIDSSGRVLIGTTNADSIGTINSHLVVGSTTNNDEVALTLNVMEGSNGRRAKFFLDDDDGVFGIDSTASTGVPPFVVRVAGNEKLRIDSSGRLLVGTTTEGFATYGDKFTIADSGHCGMTIRSGTSNYGTIYFSDADDGSADEVRGFLEYYHSTNTLSLGSNGAARLKFTSAGDMEVQGHSNSSPYPVRKLKWSNDQSTTNGFYIAQHSDRNARIWHEQGLDIIFGTNNTERLRINHQGKVEVKSAAGNDALTITPTASASTSLIFNTWPDNSSGRNWAIRNRYNAHGRLEFMRSTSNSNSPLTMVMYLDGSNVHIAGTLSKNAGSFKIPHPLVGLSTTKDLVHSFIEGPQMDLIYRGKVTLSSGAATVNLDTVSNMTEGTFVELNRDVQCFTTNETGWGAVKGSVSGNILTINAQDGSSTDTISWMVIGERQDDTVKSLDLTDDNGDLIVEPLKESVINN